MEAEELSAFVAALRADRKISKESVTKRKEKAAKSEKAGKKAKGLLEALSPKEIAQLLRELGDDKGRELLTGPEAASQVAAAREGNGV